MHPKSLIAYIARTRATIESGLAHLEAFKSDELTTPEHRPASDVSLSDAVAAEYRTQLGNALGQLRALSRAEAAPADEGQTVDLRSDEYREVAK